MYVSLMLGNTCTCSKYMYKTDLVVIPPNRQ